MCIAIWAAVLFEQRCYWAHLGATLLLDLLGHENGVDDVDDSVPDLHVAADDLGIPVDGKVLIGSRKCNGAALNRRRRSARQKIRSRHGLSADDVQGEDVRQRTLRVCHCGTQCGWVNLGKGIVGRSTDRERTFAVERVNEPGSLDRFDQGREVRIVRRCGSRRIGGHASEGTRAVSGD